MAKNISYQPRFYRETMGNFRWKNFRAEYLESDIWVPVDSASYLPDMTGYARERLVFYRGILDDHIRQSPEFMSSLIPLEIPGSLHPLVCEMYKASKASGTGPMSAVAGAIAEHICNDLLEEYGCTEVIVENGGDIYMKVVLPATISVYAGSSPLSGKIGLVIKPGDTPLSVCCSSGTIGHSISFGVADACMIACRSGALADAYATAFCNEVKSPDSINRVTEAALKKCDILSVVIIKDDRTGIGGQLEVKFLH